MSCSAVVPNLKAVITKLSKEELMSSAAKLVTRCRNELHVKSDFKQIEFNKMLVKVKLAGL